MNGDLFLIYTTEEGGFYRVRRTTQEEYDKVRRSGLIDVSSFGVDRDHPEFSAQYDAAKMVALLEVKDNFDYGLGRER